MSTRGFRRKRGDLFIQIGDKRIAQPLQGIGASLYRFVKASGIVKG